jgi:hypothetical protein
LFIPKRHFLSQGAIFLSQNSRKVNIVYSLYVF